MQYGAGEISQAQGELAVPELTLYTYARSSAAFRVRIALNLKGLDYTPLPVDLLRDGGENWQPDYLAVNPQGLVPTLMDGRRVVVQTPAILEYLEERFPDPPLLPDSARSRAYVRALCAMISCDVHPLNTLRVMSYLEQRLGASAEQRLEWYQHWVTQGLDAVEKFLLRHARYDRFCYGDRPTLADACLVPQVFNAQQYNCDLTGLPTIRSIYAHCMAQPAFQAAAPDSQPDGG